MTEKTEHQTNEEKAKALLKLIDALIDTQAAGLSLYSDGDMVHRAMSELKILGYSIRMTKGEK